VLLPTSATACEHREHWARWDRRAHRDRRALREHKEHNAALLQQHPERVNQANARVVLFRQPAPRSGPSSVPDATLAGARRICSTIRG
jgi:hypothetical protein